MVLRGLIIQSCGMLAVFSFSALQWRGSGRSRLHVRDDPLSIFKRGKVRIFIYLRCLRLFMKQVSKIALLFETPNYFL
jgi:hypothetical protein